MSIFGLVKKAWKVKFGKKEEELDRTVHDEYMETRLIAEDLTRSHGIEFHLAYGMSHIQLESNLNVPDAELFISYKRKMDKLFPSLTPLQQNHWAKANREGQLFGAL